MIVRQIEDNNTFEEKKSLKFLELEKKVIPKEFSKKNLIIDN